MEGGEDSDLPKCQSTLDVAIFVLINIFVYEYTRQLTAWADPSLHLLLLKSSMGGL